MKSARTHIQIAIALLAPTLAMAGPFSPFEARGFAMGGAGVASSEYAAATLYNPALLAIKSEGNRFSFIAPALGASARGTEGAYDNAKHFSDSKSLDSFNNAANAFNTALETYVTTASTPAGPANGVALQNQAAALKSASDQVLQDLKSVNQKAFQLGVGGTLALAFPRGDYKGAFSISTDFIGRATTDVTQSDLDLIGNTVTNVVGATGEVISHNGFVNLADPFTSQVIDPLTGKLKLGGDNAKPTSRVHVVGAAITDIGISMAKPFDIRGETYLFGITPKLQQITTVAFDADVDTKTIKFNQNKRNTVGFNVDLGVAKQFEEGKLQNVRLGLVVHNLIPRTLKTVDPTQNIKLAPQVRVGAAYSSKFFTITSDLDLTANKVVGQGSEQSQIFAVGGELSAWDVAKLRLGYRDDFKAKCGAVTAGVSLFGVQLSAAYAKDREASVMLQAGGSF
jgi:hypothetical protein